MLELTSCFWLPDKSPKAGPPCTPLHLTLETTNPPFQGIIFMEKTSFLIKNTSVNQHVGHKLIYFYEKNKQRRILMRFVFFFFPRCPWGNKAVPSKLNGTVAGCLVQRPRDSLVTTQNKLSSPGEHKIQHPGMVLMV